MPTLGEIQRFAATPMARYESRAAAARPARIGLYCVAGLLDLAAGALLVARCFARDREDDLAPFGDSVLVAGALVLLAILVFVPMVWSVGLSAAAIAGERERGTLEALLLTPLDRRTLLWAKLIGRTNPPRHFMLATVPAYLCSAACLTLVLLVPDQRGSGGDQQASALVVTIEVLLATAAAVAIWGILFYQMHAAAAAGLWFSSKYHHVWTASLVTYLAIIGPTVLLVGCGGIVSLAWPMVLGPALFDELVTRFDERALGPDA